MEYTGFYLFVICLSWTYMCVVGRTVVLPGGEGLTEHEAIVHPALLIGHTSKERHKRDVGCQDISCRSLCPWTMVKDVQDGRVPRNIYRAECMNATCDYDFDRSYLGNRAKRSLQILTECELVYTEVEVMLNGKVTWIPWPMACACSKTRSRTFLRLGKGIVMSDVNRMASAGMSIY